MSSPCAERTHGTGSAFSRPGLRLRSLPASLLTVWILAWGAPQAAAHALYAETLPHEGVVLLQFAYAGGQAPAYTAVEVYSPADAKVEFQNGRTDARGRFAFLPDAPGLWRVILADNMGHRVEHPVEVGTPGASPKSVGTEPTGGFSMPLRALLGVSLLANLALGAALRRRRRA